jgi:CPA2 family monovalent cation:H+ antiporter-2
MAMLLGNLAERLGQNVIVGYLIAGTLVGPNALGWISTHAELLNIAEIGVALLLFSIGLEFSPRRLLEFGPAALKIGASQVVLTTAVAYLGGLAVGLADREALIIGMMVAMSSTACVLRLLTDRAEVETPHGRSALGILLVQDAAVVPMILLVSAMTTGGTAGQVLWKLLLALLAAAVLLGVFYVLFNVVAPRLFLLPTYRRNRDLPVLLAVIMAVGSAGATHAVGLSPALGAFAAGILLATSPFAIQIRADTRPLMTLMVTLFFAAIGLFGDPVWLAAHWKTVTVVVLGIIIGKPAIIALVSRVFGQPWRYGIAAALCLSQVGEFSFVLATIAQSEVAGPALITPLTFRTMVSATIVTLLITPYFVVAAPRVGGVFETAVAKLQRALPWGYHTAEQPTAAKYGGTAATDDRAGRAHPVGIDLILIIGFGAVGQSVAQALPDSRRDQVVAIDLDPRNIKTAKRAGLTGQLGDAAQRDILDHAGINRAQAVVITLRSHITARHLIHLIRDLSPETSIISRCQHHVHYFELLYAGAHEVVDEQTEVGQRLAMDLAKHVEAGD